MEAAAVPFGPPTGCALLVPRLAANMAWAKVSLASEPGRARPATLRWQMRGRSLALTYTYASPGAALPAAVVESVDGVERLRVVFRSARPRTFGPAEFALPAGGAQ